MSMNLARRKTPRISQPLSKMLHKALSPMILIPLRDKFGGERDVEIEMLEKVVRRGDNVIDVGAHLGAYTFVLARLVGRKGAVWAFEPSPACHIYLKRGFRFSRRVILSNIALSSKNLDLVLHSPSSPSTNQLPSAESSISHQFINGQKEIVTGKTLDSLNLRDISFIKIDTEGHELEVLTGAIKTIRGSRPILLIEIFRDIPFDKSIAIWKLLQEFNYTAHCIINNQISVLEMNHHLGAVTSREKDRSVNFFFIPESRNGSKLI